MTDASGAPPGQLRRIARPALGPPPLTPIAPTALPSSITRQAAPGRGDIAEGDNGQVVPCDRILEVLARPLKVHRRAGFALRHFDRDRSARRPCARGRSDGHRRRARRSPWSTLFLAASASAAAAIFFAATWLNVFFSANCAEARPEENTIVKSTR